MFGIMKYACLIFIIFGFVCIQAHFQTQDVSCATCMHMSFTLSSVPKNVKNMLGLLLSRMSNPSCLTSKATKMKCETQADNLINKCQTTTVNVRALGMKNSYSDAVMNMTVVVKTCSPEPVGTPDRCIDFKDMDAETLRKMTAKIQKVRRQWNEADMNGNTCYQGPQSRDVQYEIDDENSLVSINKEDGRQNNPDESSNKSTMPVISMMLLIFLFVVNIFITIL